MRIFESSDYGEENGNKSEDGIDDDCEEDED